MRRLQHWISLLYPAKWRARYGDEFAALLEQFQPTPFALLDLTVGAFRMHMTEWSYSRFAAVFCLAGIVAGTLGQFAIHDKFLSSAVVGIPSEKQWDQATHKLFSRNMLKAVIEEQNLYPEKRLRQPLEDIVEQMREKDLQANAISPSQAELRFIYPDPGASQRTLLALMSRLERDSAFHTIHRSSVPDRVDPNRYILFFTFFGATLVIGGTGAAMAQLSWQKWKILVLYGFIGGALASGASFLFPHRYTSRAVVMSTDANLLRSYKLKDENIAALIAEGHLFGGDDHGRIPMNRLVERFRRDSRFSFLTSPGGTPLLSIQVSSEDPQEAHRLVQRMITLVCETFAGAPANVEVRENASLPDSHLSPTRVAVACAGFGLGLIGGWFRHFRTSQPAIGEARVV